MDELRELDVRIAEALGWKVIRYEDGGISVQPVQRYPYTTHIVYCPEDPPMANWNPSTDIAAAWELVEWFAKHRGDGFFLIQDWHGPITAGSGYYKASFLDQAHWANAPTAPEAICRAFLAAMNDIQTEEG